MAGGFYFLSQQRFSCFRVLSSLWEELLFCEALYTLMVLRCDCDAEFGTKIPKNLRRPLLDEAKSPSHPISCISQCPSDASQRTLDSLVADILGYPPSKITHCKTLECAPSCLPPINLVRLKSGIPTPPRWELCSFELLRKEGQIITAQWTCLNCRFGIHRFKYPLMPMQEEFFRGPSGHFWGPLVWICGIWYVWGSPGGDPPWIPRAHYPGFTLFSPCPQFECSLPKWWLLTFL